MKPLDKQVQLSAAAGPTCGTRKITLEIPPLDEGKCDALILPRTPSVISVGERCVEHRCSFRWPA
eukprot:12921240-Prorocentrum_lima.AAC.1